MDVSQMSSNVSETESEEQESGSYQYEQEQDQECDGYEVFALEGKGKDVFSRNLFQMWNERTQS